MIEGTTSEKALREESGIVEPAPQRSGTAKWRLWVSMALSLGFLVLALHDVRLSEVAIALRQVDVLLLSTAVGSYVVTVVAKAARWRLLLAVRKAPSLGRTFSMLAIGQMVNAFVPARLGELIRAYLMGEAEADSKIYVLGTIAVEKVTDLAFLLLALAFLLSQIALPEWLAGPARATALVTAVLLPFLALLVWQNEFVLRGIERTRRFISAERGEWLVRQVRLGLASLDVVKRPRLLSGFLAWSLLIWILGASTNYLVFLAMRLSLPVWAALLLLAVLQAGVAVPSSPGRIGIFHYLTIITLSLFAVEKEVALGYAVVLHLVVYVPMVLLGVYGLWREKVTWQILAEATTRLNRLSKKQK